MSDLNVMTITSSLDSKNGDPESILWMLATIISETNK